VRKQVEVKREAMNIAIPSDLSTAQGACC